jgi:hypothetical protein
MWLFVPPALLILVFPDGRLPGRRWRWVAYSLVIVPLLFMFPAAADPTPSIHPCRRLLPHLVRLPDPWDLVVGIVGLVPLPVFLGLLVASAASMVVRYRRASGIVRTQVKWFMLGRCACPRRCCWVGSAICSSAADPVLVGFALTYLAAAGDGDRGACMTSTTSTR